MTYSNIYGEVCKPNYEVALKTYSSMNPNAKNDYDFETVAYGIDGTYRECVKNAKEWSKKIGKKCLNSNTDILTEVAIVCYLNHDECSYEPVWEEIYISGKKQGRYVF